MVRCSILELKLQALFLRRCAAEQGPHVSCALFRGLSVVNDALFWS